MRRGGVWARVGGRVSVSVWRYRRMRMCGGGAVYEGSGVGCVGGVDLRWCECTGCVFVFF